MWNFIYGGAVIALGLLFAALALVEYLTAAQERAARKSRHD